MTPVRMRRQTQSFSPGVAKPCLTVDSGEKVPEGRMRGPRRSQEVSQAPLTLALSPTAQQERDGNHQLGRGRVPKGATAGSSSSAVQRRGITLLEVLVSLAIFLVAVTAISQLISTGSRASVDAELEGEAVLRAESVLSEILAGIHPMESAQATPFQDDFAWKWTLEVGEGPHSDLLLLNVTVYRQEQETDQPLMPYTLSRLARNPEIFLDASLEGSE